MNLTVYTDGSYNSNNHTYGGGIVVLVPGLSNPLEHKVAGNDNNFARFRNVAGEIIAVKAALDIAKQVNGCTSLTIHYDYEGLEKWVTGEWKAKNHLSKAYAQVVRDTMKLFDIRFVKESAHTGVKYNERADTLAKEACRV